MTKKVGGGKIVNLGRISGSEPALSSAYLEWDYPVTSTIIVSFRTSMIDDEQLVTIVGSDKSRNAFTPGPGDSLVSVNSISPTEDDYYIYEVIIE